MEDCRRGEGEGKGSLHFEDDGGGDWGVRAEDERNSTGAHVKDQDGGERLCSFEE